jgi:hypothetical protein
MEELVLVSRFLNSKAVCYHAPREKVPVRTKCGMWFGGLNDPWTKIVTRAEAEAMGRRPCKLCYEVGAG